MENTFKNVNLDDKLDLEEMVETIRSSVFMSEKEKREQRLRSMGITPANKPKKNKRKKKRK
jgi:hypothetical protein